MLLYFLNPQYGPRRSGTAISSMVIVGPIAAINEAPIELMIMRVASICFIISPLILVLY